MNEPLEAEAPPSPELKQRVIRALRREGVLRKQGVGWPFAARIAAALVLFAGGVMMGRASTAPVAEPEGNQYLLALHEDARFAPDRPEQELVQEYGGWANDLGARGRLVVAEQLGWGALLPEQTGTPPGAPPAGTLGQMSGFFLIRADDREEALAVARTHPHLRYGGTIEVREIVR